MSGKSLDGIERNDETGKYWDCQHCWWEGPEARIDFHSYEVFCPECDSVIDDRLSRMVHAGGSR